MRNNLLTKVPHLCAFKNLWMLDLSGNKIESIDNITFCDLPRLYKIDLSNNGLTTVGDNTFGRLPDLGELDLSLNKIVFLPENWIAPNYSVRYLNLTSNRFISTDKMSLMKMNHLKKLSIGNNPIQTMSMTNLPKSIVNLYLF